jgi:hypothetical protein
MLLLTPPTDHKATATCYGQTSGFLIYGDSSAYPLALHIFSIMLFFRTNVAHATSRVSDKVRGKNSRGSIAVAAKPAGSVMFVRSRKLIVDPARNAEFRLLSRHPCCNPKVTGSVFP